MRVEMLEEERELLREMLGRDITPACAQLHARIRKRLLLTGHSYPMQKEVLAIIAELADCVPQVPPERDVESNGHVEATNGHKDPTPDDLETVAAREEIEKLNGEINPDAAGGAYKGNRITWPETPFKSTPKTPIHKLEKGRPVMYLSERDNAWHAGKFVRMNTNDKAKANILSAEMKKAFAVPIRNIKVQDLSRPSTEPLAVQI